MALNISAWSIRQPLPAGRPLDHPAGARLDELHQAAGHAAAERRHSGDLRRRGAIRRGALRARGAGHQDHRGRRLRRRRTSATSPPQITDGLSVTTIQFSLDTNTDRALNDVKDAVTRVRANLPQNINEPLIQRVDVVGTADPDLCRDLAGQDAGASCRGSSTTSSSARCRACAASRQVERIGGVDREILVSLDPDRLAGRRPDRARRQPAAARHQCRRRRRPRRNRRATTRRSARSPARTRSTTSPAR